MPPSTRNSPPVMNPPGQSRGRLPFRQYRPASTKISTPEEPIPLAAPVMMAALPDSSPTPTSACVLRERAPAGHRSQDSHREGKVPAPASSGRNRLGTLPTGLGEVPAVRIPKPEVCTRAGRHPTQPCLLSPINILYSISAPGQQAQICLKLLQTQQNTPDAESRPSRARQDFAHKASPEMGQKAQPSA